MSIRNQINKRFFDKVSIFLLFTGYLVAIVTFIAQMWFIGYNTADDTVASAKLVSEYSGLFSNGFSKRPVWYISSMLNFLRVYFPSDHVNFRLFTILPILSAVFVFSYILGKIYRSRVVAFAASFFLLASFQHAWFHHSLTSFPFNLNFSFLILLISMILFHRFLLAPRKFYLGFLSGLLFSLSFMIYEIFAPYLILYIFIFIMHQLSLKESQKYQAYFSGVVLFSIPVIFLVSTNILYLAGDAQTGVYGGTKLKNNFSIYSYITAVKTFSFSALPGTVFSVYKHHISSFFNLEYKRYFEFSDLFSQMRLNWIVVPLGFVGFSMMVLRKMKCLIFSKSQHLFILLSSIILIFFPNILLSLSEAHQRRANSTEIIYSGTHFSLFGWIFLYTWILLLISKVQNKFLYFLFLILFTLTSFKYIYRTQISNTFVANSQALHYSAWTMLEKLYKKNPDFFENSDTMFLSTNMYGEQIRFWGIFHRGWGWDYWYRFTKNAFGVHLSIFKSVKDCNKVIKNCDQRKIFNLGFNLDYSSRGSSIKICPMTYEGKKLKVQADSSECTVERFKAFF